jgi:two-component system phosphate regulon sensor histidine kinase PhoR
MKLLVRIVPYGADRRLLLARDVTRLHRLEQMRKDFVANVSHELRSPLTVIVGYLENLTDDDSTPDELRRPLQQMARQADRMCLIVEDLLRLSRIEDQPGGAPRDEIAVAEMLERIHADAAKLDQGKHEIHSNVDKLVRVLGEYNELYSAFSNLVFNALQYTPQGGEVFIHWVKTADGARLEVRDTGIGIEAHHIPRLTERFYRIDKARSREVGGTGLGLAIVKHVLLRHDASLKVDSKPGEGSTFQCIFPPSRIAISEDSKFPARA